MSTKPKKVLLMDPFASAELVRSLLGDASDAFDVVESDTVAGHSDAAVLFIGPELLLTDADVRSLSNLELVVVTSTGFDHVPLAAVSAQGAWTATSAGYCTVEVADHALALILGGIRKISLLDAQVRAGGWDVEALAPRRITGATVALIGFGRIAQALAARLRALSVHVRAYDPLVPVEVFETAGVTAGGTLLDTIAGCDAISVHVPLTLETEGLIDAAALAALRPGACVVNVARGGVIDEEALLSAIASGHIGSAGLDVFQEEPLPLSSTLRGVEGITLGPHSAWYSPQAQRESFVLATESLLDLHNGREPRGAVARPADTAG